MPSLLIVGEEDLLFSEVTSEWLKGFEVYLRSRGCSWNTVSTYLRTFRAVYNRAVDLRKAPYIPHLFRSVYTGTRADHKRALCDDDMKKCLPNYLVRPVCHSLLMSGARVVHSDVFASWYAVCRSRLFA